MKKHRFRLLFLLASLVLPLAAIDVWFTSAPGSADHNAGYYIEATAYSSSGWGGSSLTLYKSGSYLSDTTGGDGYFSVGTWQADGGPQTIEYYAEASDWYWGEWASAWHYISINAPSNSAPFGVCDYAHASVPVNGNLYAAGWAVDNEMGAPVVSVEVLIDGSVVATADNGGDRYDVADAYGRSDFRYSGWGINYNIGARSVGTHSLEFRAWDNQGASGNFGYRTFEVTNSSPDITLLSPGAQTINLNTTLTISSHATDPDGDITAHNLDIQRPDGSWNWNGGFASGEPYMGGPVGSGADSTRSVAFTFDIPGTWYVRSWVSDSVGNNLHSATVAITVNNPNHPPAIAWSTTPPAAPGTGTVFTARATGTDQDGNLVQVAVDVSTNGGAWTAFAYNNGGNGSTNTSDGNLVTAGAVGTTYQFRALASDSSGANSGYIQTAVSTVVKLNQAAVTITSSATATYGSTYTGTATGGNGTGALSWSLGTGSTAPGAAVNASTGTITANGIGSVVLKVRRLADANYNDSSWSADFPVTVNKATLTVTANNASRNYGAANPAFAASYSGFVNGDTAAVLTGTPALTTTATAGSAAGTYPITAAAGTLAATNYQLAFVNGTLTVNKVALTVTANDTARSYGAANPAFTASYSGFVNGDTTAALTGAPALATTATAASPVGIYPITAGAGTLAAANYTFTFVNGALTVGKATLTITANNAAKSYGDANPAFGYTPAGFVNGDTAAVLSGAPALGTTATTGSPVGTYAITAAAGTLAATNYQFTFVNGTLTVNKATLTITANNAAKTYGAANPAFGYAPTGFVNGDTAAVLTGAPGLATTATAASPAGTYPITPSTGSLAATNYQFAFVNGTLTVNKATLTITANSAARAYGAANPAFGYTPTGFVNGDTATVLTGAPALTTAATATSVIGTYPITGAAGSLTAANYQFSFADGTLTVNKATLTVTATNLSKNYGAANPTLTAGYTGFVNGETTAVLSGTPALATSAVTGSPVGSYAITAAAGTLTAANYQFTFANGTLTVNKATLTITASDAARSYGAANPAFGYTPAGFVNGDTAAVLTGTPSLTTAATTGSSAGTYPITPSAGSLTATNYQFSFANGTLTVNKVALTVTADNTSRGYGAANPTFTASYTGFVNGDTAAVLTGAPALTTAATPSSALGTYPITAAAGTLAATNYTFTFANGTLTVNKATLTITANNTAKTYGAANPALGYTPTGFVNGDTAAVLSGAPALTTTATTGSAAGSYVITAAAGSLAATNYQFTFANGTLTVSKATLTVTADSMARSYGAANPALTASYSGYVNGDTAAALTGAPALTTTATAGSAAGSYAITAAAGTLAAVNYQFNFANGTLTVNKVTLTVTATDTSRSYGAANPTFTASYTGFVNGDTTAVLTGAPALATAATNTSALGTYPITAAAGTLAATNYTFTFVNGTLTVGKAILTVTADNGAKSYSSANPALTASYSGFVNGDTAAVLTGAPALATTATTGSSAGTYPITVATGTLAATNYQFTFVSGTLTVNKVTLTITATSASRSYGVANPTFSYTPAGFVNGDTAAVLTGTPSLTTTATTGSAAGTYAITPATGSLAATNYQFTFVNGTLTVSKVTLTITANSVARSYGAANPAFGYTPTGFVNGDTTAVLTGAPSLTTTATTASAIGTYPITAAAGTLAATNYTFTFANGTLTVNKATLTVGATALTSPYGATRVFTPAYSGFVNSDTAAVLSGAPALSSAATLTSAPGSYTITAAAGTLAAANYQFSFVTAALTISKADPAKVFANRTRNLGTLNYTVLTGDLDAAFSHPSNPGSVSAPSGTTTYSLVGPGTPVVAGTALVGGATRIIRASYPGDANYNAATIDSNWQLDYVDTDTDGLPDYWEQLYLNTLSYAGSADPFSVGRTLTQSFQQGLSPWPAPSVATGLQAWYRADLGVIKDGANSVSQWLDASGHGRHLQQATANQQPLWVGAVSNGQPAVDFDAGEHVKSAAAALQAAGSDLTVITVLLPAATQSSATPVTVDFDADTQSGFSLRRDSGLANHALRWRNQAQTAWEGATAPVVPAAASTLQLITFIKGGTTQTGYLNTAQQATATVAAAMYTPTAALALGRSVTTATSYYSGKIAEVLIYDRALTPTERQQVESALVAKYAVNVTDLDGDGIPNVWEDAHGLNKLDPADAAQDRDHDGLTNLQEYQQGRDIDWPDNPAISLIIFTPNN